MTVFLQAHERNQLLAGLPTLDKAFLAPELRVEHPPRGRVLCSRSEPPAEIWFPQSGLVALATTDEDGHTTQAGMVGSEGCIGVESLLDDAPVLADATVQIEGDVSVISASRFRAALKARPAIRAAVLRYFYALTAQLVQERACDHVHTLERRCCRALLLMQDSIGRDELAVTQESLATLLGGSRARINTVLGTLERKGVLCRQRGRIRLLRRAGLEERSCDCYPILRRILDSLGLPTKRLRSVA